MNYLMRVFNRYFSLDKWRQQCVLRALYHSFRVSIPSYNNLPYYNAVFHCSYISRERRLIPKSSSRLVFHLYSLLLRRGFPSQWLVGAKRHSESWGKKAPWGDLLHMRLCGQLSIITTLNIQFIGVNWSEAVNLPADDNGRVFTRRKSRSKLIPVAYQLWLRYAKSGSWWARLSTACHCYNTQQNHQKFLDDLSVAVQIDPGVRHRGWSQGCRCSVGCFKKSESLKC